MNIGAVPEQRSVVGDSRFIYMGFEPYVYPAVPSAQAGEEVLMLGWTFRGLRYGLHAD